MEGWAGIEQPDLAAARECVCRVRQHWRQRYDGHPIALAQFVDKYLFDAGDWAYVENFLDSVLGDAEVLASVYEGHQRCPGGSEFDRFWEVAADRFVGFVDVHTQLGDGAPADAVGGDAEVEPSADATVTTDELLGTHLVREQWPLVTTLAGQAATRVWRQGWDPDPRDSRRAWRVPLIGTALRTVSVTAAWPFEGDTIEVVREGGGRARPPFLEWTNDVCEDAGERIHMQREADGSDDETWNQVRSCGMTLRAAVRNEALDGSPDCQPIAELLRERRQR